MKMKKFLIISVAILSLFMVGCGKKSDKKDEKVEKKYEEAMEKFAEDYYIKFMNKYLTTPIVTLKDLRAIKKSGYADYDLSALDKCQDSSYTEIELEETTNKIIGYKHHLECK